MIEYLRKIIRFLGIGVLFTISIMWILHDKQPTNMQVLLIILMLLGTENRK